MNTYDDDRYDNALHEVDRLRAELAETREDLRRADAPTLVAVNEVHRLRAELETEEWGHGDTKAHLAFWKREAGEAEDAIARVRELVRHYDPSDPGAAYYSRGDILHALDGGTE